MDNYIETDHLKDIIRKKIKSDSFATESDAKIWEGVYNQIQTKEAKVINLNYFKYAASILFLVFAGVLGAIHFYSSQENTEQLISSDVLQTITLPDGSIVTLNSGSELKYYSDFTEQRNLSLKGEAYFEVSHNKDLPFTINFSGYKLTVLGTKFHIRNIPAENTKEVTVSEGRVKIVADDSNNEMIVNVGQQLKLTGLDEPKLSNVQAENYIFWKTGELKFEKTSIGEIANLLSRKYNKEIILSPNLRNCKFTGDLSNLSLDEALQVVSLSVFLKVELAGDKIILMGQPCD